MAADSLLERWSKVDNFTKFTQLRTQCVRN